MLIKELRRGDQEEAALFQQYYFKIHFLENGSCVSQLHLWFLMKKNPINSQVSVSK